MTPADIQDKDGRHSWCRSLSDWNHKIWKFLCGSCWSSLWLCWANGGKTSYYEQEWNKNFCLNVCMIILTNILEHCRVCLISSLSRIFSHTLISGTICLSSTKQEECPLDLYNHKACESYFACDFDEWYQDLWHLPCSYYFRFVFDAMHAVTGAYAKPIFVDKLGVSPVCFSLNVANLIITFHGKYIVDSVFLKCFVCIKSRIQFQMGLLWKILGMVIQIPILRELPTLVMFEITCGYLQNPIATYMLMTVMLKTWSILCMVIMPLILVLQVMVC